VTGERESVDDYECRKLGIRSGACIAPRLGKIYAACKEA
jgi:hypothetical protein